MFDQGNFERLKIVRELINLQAQQIATLRQAMQAATERLNLLRRMRDNILINHQEQRRLNEDGDSERRISGG